MASKPKQAGADESAAKRSRGGAVGHGKKNNRGTKANSRASKRRRRCKTLSKRLAERLDHLAKEVPYAAQLAAKLRSGCEETTLGDVVVDAMCMFALKGNATILRSLWERSEGKPPGPPPLGEDEPRRIQTPVKGPEPSPDSPEPQAPPRGPGPGAGGTCLRRQEE